MLQEIQYFFYKITDFHIRRMHELLLISSNSWAIYCVASPLDLKYISQTSNACGQVHFTLFTSSSFQNSAASVNRTNALSLNCKAFGVASSFICYHYKVLCTPMAKSVQSFPLNPCSVNF